MSSYVSKGDTIEHTPQAAVAVGAMVAIGTGMVGVADRPIAAGELGGLVVEGVFAVDKATGAGTDFAVGSRVFLNTSTGKAVASSNSGAYPPIGVVLVQPTTAAENVIVKLSR